jgi:hypothetical protein
MDHTFATSNLTAVRIGTIAARAALKTFVVLFVYSTLRGMQLSKSFVIRVCVSTFTYSRT